MSMHLAAKRIRNLPTASAIIACAALALLPACQRGQDEDAVEIRPVR